MRHENHLRIFRGPPDPQLWVHQFNYCKSSNEFRMVWDGSSCSFHQCKLRALHAIFAPEAVWGDRQGMVRPWWGWAGWFTADNLEPQKNIKKWLWTCLEVDFWEKKMSSKNRFAGGKLSTKNNEQTRWFPVQTVALHNFISPSVFFFRGVEGIRLNGRIPGATCIFRCRRIGSYGTRWWDILI